MNMKDNKGIAASGNARVTGSAVASGNHARAEVRNEAPALPGDAERLSPEQIRDLLTRLIEEAGQAGLEDPAAVVEMAEDARAELEAPRPRLGKLRGMAEWLSKAVEKLEPLASLAVTIERAIHGL